MLVDQKEQIWVSNMEKIDDSKFEIIKVRINPYAYIVDSGFENVNSDIVLNHKTYHVFKNRIQNNVLELYCLKNSHLKLISKDLKDSFDSQFFGNSSNKENPIKKILKSILKDYIANDAVCFDFNNKAFTMPQANFNASKSASLPGYCTTNHPPPDFI
jgi:hypothetical protein